MHADSQALANCLGGTQKEQDMKTDDKKFWERVMWVNISEQAQSLKVFRYHVNDL